MSCRVALMAVVVGVLGPTGQAQQSPPIADLKTTPEATGFKSTSTYEDVVKFMKAVDDASPNIHYTTYGTTSEGRAMPLAIVSAGLRNPTADIVRRSGKLRVHIQGNVHAGEVEGKESAQILLRAFAAGQHADWLKSTVFLITPIFNADGNEKFGLNNRPRQNGPINGMGTRANAQNLNINRDFMKIETPEGLAFVKLWVDYDPHVGIDLHTSNGSNHGYFLTYSPPLHPNTSGAIMSILKDEWFPFITKNVKATHGWDTFYYGNASSPGGRGRRGAGAAPAPADTPPQPAGPREWRTFEHVPRFHNNYVGLRNRFALLSEAYSYATFEDRIKATNYFLDEALTFAHRNAAKLMKAISAADGERISGTSQGTRAQIRRGGMIEILMGEVEEEKNPNSGAVMNRRKDVVHPEQMVDMLWFEPSATEVAAEAYYVPADAKRAVDVLNAHGVQMKKLTQPVRGVEQFTITGNTTRASTGSIDLGSHALRTLEGTWAAAPGVTVPAGAWAVSLNQPLARLAFYLLEPRSDDGLLAWNYLDDLLKDGSPYPILRKK